MPITVKKVLHYPDGGWIDSVLLTELGGSLYRLEDTDLEEGLHYHDVVHAKQRTDGDLEFVRVVERSDFKSYDWILVEELVESNAMDRVFSEVAGLGGHAASYYVGCVHIALPRGVNYDPWLKLKEYGKALFERLEREARNRLLIGKWFTNEYDKGIEFKHDGTYESFKVVIITEAEEGRELKRCEAGRWTWLDTEHIAIEEPGLPKTEIKLDSELYNLAIPRPDGTVLHMSRDD